MAGGVWIDAVKPKASADGEGMGCVCGFEIINSLIRKNLGLERVLEG